MAEGQHEDARDDAQQWWYNHRTGQVEEGRLSLSSDRDGPYATREEAEHAPEIARRRAAEWAAEDAADD